MLEAVGLLQYLREQQCQPFQHIPYMFWTKLTIHKPSQNRRLEHLYNIIKQMDNTRACFVTKLIASICFNVKGNKVSIYRAHTFFDFASCSSWAFSCLLPVFSHLSCFFIICVTEQPSKVLIAEKSLHSDKGLITISPQRDPSPKDMLGITASKYSSSIQWEFPCRGGTT